MSAWLGIVGIGEDGMDGLSPSARAVVEAAEVIIGGDRHHRLSDAVQAERLAWPSPFDAMIDVIRSHRGKRLVILVTGDPLWYSVGARILKAIPAAEVTFHPQLSAFQWGAARMGWSLADVETLTVHGRPVEQAIPFFAPNARLLVLTRDGDTPGEVAALLAAHGYGPSAMTVLGALGGPRESRIDGVAESWAAESPAFHLLAIECRAAPGARVLPKGPGLPDDAFEHDGKMTKSEVRALTLSQLAPRRHGVLWDVGAGCGSVGVEWLRLARDGAAYGIEPRADRRDMAARNALKLGAPRLTLIDGTAPEALEGLPTPDAIFIGGGLSEQTIDVCRAALAPQGRLVANAVTLESEALLIAAHARHGGTLTRLSVARAEPVGPFRGWRAAMPVTQWVWHND
ncbi:precorrin-6y C5,15-methyltransferase (decarboxylating) subunit CbiE [Oceanibium sediminis]|uniref:precorrin-6y C5,15-methyltransferase (decarboxylating) subunit CbiE n=1 Tax=Oceanibium sediminis TaxID=2026339 RepID=UPI000DD3D64E|nr:precorrin-6y C5,15-methyltransferase (decarboxylating) subunit CbiE [Oceanibium sediminis]